MGIVDTCTSWIDDEGRGVIEFGVYDTAPRIVKLEAIVAAARDVVDTSRSGAEEGWGEIIALDAALAALDGKE